MLSTLICVEKCGGERFTDDVRDDIINFLGKNRRSPLSRWDRRGRGKAGRGT